MLVHVWNAPKEMERLGVMATVIGRQISVLELQVVLISFVIKTLIYKCVDNYRLEIYSMPYLA